MPYIAIDLRGLAGIDNWCKKKKDTWINNDFDLTFLDGKKGQKIPHPNVWYKNNDSEDINHKE